MDDTQLQELYTWVDGIPLSRPKRNITRDFGDGGGSPAPSLPFRRESLRLAPPTGASVVAQSQIVCRVCVPQRCVVRPATVLTAETVAHFCPKLVELHNYSAANGQKQKMYNWQTLRRPVTRAPPAAPAHALTRAPVFVSASACWSDPGHGNPTCADRHHSHAGSV